MEVADNARRRRALGTVVTVAGRNTGYGFCASTGALAVVRSHGIDAVSELTSMQLCSRNLTDGAALVWAGSSLVFGAGHCVGLVNTDGSLVENELTEHVCAVAASSAYIVACSTRTVWIWDESFSQVDSMRGKAWRNCAALCGNKLCALGALGTFIWTPGQGFAEVQGIEEARCAAGIDLRSAAVLMDARIRLSDAAPVSTSATSTPILRGEPTLSGFGGGEIPAGFLLSTLVPENESLPTLCLLRDDRKHNVAPIDRFGTIVDLIAANHTFVFVASSFLPAVASYCARNLHLLNVVDVSQLNFMESPTKSSPKVRRTIRGLIPPTDHLAAPLVMFAEGVVDPLPFSSARKPRLETLYLAEDLFELSSASQPRPGPLCRNSTPTGQRPADDDLLKLRNYVDLRLDGLEAKLDRLIQLSLTKIPTPVSTAATN